MKKTFIEFNLQIPETDYWTIVMVISRQAGIGGPHLLIFII